MDKKKKFLAIIVGIMVLTLALVACGKKANNDKDNSDNTDPVQDSQIEQSEGELDNDYKESDKLGSGNVVTKLVVTSDMIKEGAMFVKNNDMEQPGEIVKTKDGAQLKIEGAYNGLKCLFLRGIDLPTAEVDTM